MSDYQHRNRSNQELDLEHRNVLVSCEVDGKVSFKLVYSKDECLGFVETDDSLCMVVDIPVALMKS